MYTKFYKGTSLCECVSLWINYFIVVRTQFINLRQNYQNLKIWQIIYLNLATTKCQQYLNVYRTYEQNCSQFLTNKKCLLTTYLFFGPVTFVASSAIKRLIIALLKRMIISLTRRHCTLRVVDRETILFQFHHSSSYSYSTFLISLPLILLARIEGVTHLGRGTTVRFHHWNGLCQQNLIRLLLLQFFPFSLLLWLCLLDLQRLFTLRQTSLH